MADHYTSGDALVYPDTASAADIPLIAQKLANSVQAALAGRESRFIAVCTSGTRPAAPSAGALIYESDTKAYGVWNGVAWSMWDTTDQAYTPTWTVDAGTAPSLGNGTLTGTYRRAGGNITAQIKLVSGTTTTYSDSGGNNRVFLFALPVTAADYTLISGQGRTSYGSTTTLWYALGWSSSKVGMSTAAAAGAAVGSNYPAIPPAATAGTTWSLRVHYTA
ncbi:MAG: hypothetical protein IPG16_02735 [Comamonadaceae bacterium]|nr:hypothetical protein [Comamonadaceae bacterium]